VGGPEDGGDEDDALGGVTRVLNSLRGTWRTAATPAMRMTRLAVLATDCVTALVFLIVCGGGCPRQD
jgi:hypothetical protein